MGSIELAPTLPTPEVAQTLAVEARLFGLDGQPLVGAPVRLSTDDGTVSPTDGVTDANGNFQATWTLGTRAGTQTLRLDATDQSAEWEVEVLPGERSEVVIVAGNAQEAPVGESLPDPLIVRLQDNFGNAVAGDTARFEVTHGEGVLGSSVAITDAAGEARATLTLGAVTGPVSVQANVGPLTPVVFSATATAGPPAALTQGGDGQSGVVGTPLPSALTVEVRDANGNPVPDAALTVRIVSGGGSVDVANPTTNAQGVATFLWTLGPSAGTQQVAVDAPGLPAVDFRATAQPGPATTLTLRGGANQQGPASTPLPVPLSVVARDQFGNAVPGAGVSFSVVAGGGVLTPTSTSTDGSGVARTTFTLGSALGAHTARATLGSDAVDFPATATSGPPAQLQVVQGESQSGTVGSALPVAPAVRVLDAGSNPVPNASVSFSVQSGGGSISTSTAVTDSDGVASPGTWTLGGSAGTQVLRAEVSGVAPSTVSATALAGPASQLSVLLGANQVATVGTPVSTPPAVRVSDAYGNPVQGVAVTFSVTGGGGAVSGASQTSNTSGVATVGSWTLGPNPGQNTLTASVPSVASVDILATGVSVPTGGFDLEIQWAGSVASNVQSAMLAAAARWESVVTGDIPNTTASVPAGACGVGHAAYSGPVDDMVVFFEVTSIDGSGGTLASAGPCMVRSGTFFAIFGVVRLDAADVPTLVSNGRLTEVLIHELGHVLGIGPFWSSAGVISGAGGSDPVYTGPAGHSQYQALGGTHPGGVPVENTGGPGTRDAHWRESLLGNEVMTSFINYGSSNVLSRISVGALADLGFTVNYGAADGFSASSAATVSGASAGGFFLVEQPLPPPIVHIP